MKPNQNVNAQDAKEETQQKWYSQFAAGESQQIVSDEATGETIAVVYNDNEEDGALIAAAPELLEALEVLVQSVETCAEYLPESERKEIFKIIMKSPAFKNALNAIQKATNY